MKQIVNNDISNDLPIYRLCREGKLNQLLEKQDLVYWGQKCYNENRTAIVETIKW